jgi:hypothetical protein
MLYSRVAVGIVLAGIALAIFPTGRLRPQSVEFIVLSVIASVALVELLTFCLQRWSTVLQTKKAIFWRWWIIVTIVLSMLIATVVRFDGVPHAWWYLLTPLLSVAWLGAARFIPVVRRWGGLRKRDHKIWWIVVAVLLVWGSWIRVAALDSHVLQGDEYFHINTAKGWLETGEFVQWDWLNEEPMWERAPYTRAWPYTLQVAGSIAVFGESEVALRLPAFLWGILFLVLTPLFVHRWTRSSAIAALTTALVAFDGTFVWQATFSRMYSMLFVLTLVVVHCVYRALSGDTKNRKRRHTQRWAWLTLGWVIAAVSYLIHPVAILLIPASMCAIAVKYMQHPQHTWLRQAMTAAIALTVVGGLVVLLTNPSDLHFVTVRAKPQVAYAGYMMLASTLPVVMASLFASSIVSSLRTRSLPIIVVALSLFLPILVYFIFFANRYSAKKYVAFVLVLAYIAISWAWDQLFSRVFKPRPVSVFLSVFCFLWIAVPFSFPGFSLAGVKAAPSDRSYVQWSRHDYTTLYSYINATAESGDLLVIQGLKHYYLERTDIDYERITTKNALTKKRLQDIRASHEHGFVVLSREKKNLISDAVREQLRSEFERDNNTELTEANFIVYRW